MKIEGFEGKSTEKLKGELKSLQIVAWALAIVLFFLFSITIYGLIAKEDKSTFIALLFVAFSCGGIMPFQMIMMNKIKKELKLRESNT
ncbi:MAG: hypothetical protein R8G66_19290 [Cytophagales bacterium]|nr:hypothetical protein [Cytophagales bacterium]